MYSSPRSGPTLYSLVPSVKTSGSHESGSTETRRALLLCSTYSMTRKIAHGGPVGAGAERGAERLVAPEGEQRFIAERRITKCDAALTTRSSDDPPTRCSTPGAERSWIRRRASASGGIAVPASQSSVYSGRRRSRHLERCQLKAIAALTS